MDRSGWPWNGSLTGDLEQLAQLADHLVVAAFPETSWHAGGEVALQEGGLEGLERALDGIGLFDDLDTVLVFLDHLANAFEVTLDGRQAVQDLFLVALHGRARLAFRLASPPHRGGEGCPEQCTGERGLMSTPSLGGWATLRWRSWVCACAELRENGLIHWRAGTEDPSDRPPHPASKPCTILAAARNRTPAITFFNWSGASLKRMRYEPSRAPMTPASAMIPKRV